MILNLESLIEQQEFEVNLPLWILGKVNLKNE